MPTYSEIKEELLQISNILKTFPELIQSKVYDLLISSYLGNKVSVEAIVKGQKEKVPDTDKKTITKKKTAKQKATTSKKQSFSIIKELNLRGGDHTQSFRNFIEEKNPSSAIEFNTASVYYLKEKLRLDNVSINHIYTCYKEVKRKPPGDLIQSVRDTSGTKYGYIDSSDSDDIKIPHRGITFVDHDLPKKSEK